MIQNNCKRQNFYSWFLITNILLGFIYSTDGFTPNADENLNYTQVLFSWPQIPNTIYYQLVIDSDDTTYILYDSTNLIIYDDGLGWDNSYTWQVCGFDTNNISYCHNSLDFSILPLPSAFTHEIDIEIYNEDEIFLIDGITIFNAENWDKSYAIDKYGQPIWFVDLNLVDFLNNGNFIGFYNQENIPWRGKEINLNDNNVFTTPLEYSIHHDFKKTTYGTYYGPSYVFENHNCPNSESEGIPWRGDKIVEFDHNGNLIWSWNVFDYIDTTEYHPSDIASCESGTFDWTHMNEVYFDESTNSVYTSIRNLSRIIKIDYPSGDIIWQLGDSTLMENVYFDDDYNFSRQHNMKKLENGNIIFFNNGTYNSPIVSRCLELEINNYDLTSDLVWEYILPPDLFTAVRGECLRLDNGNTLISTGRNGNIPFTHSSIIEVNQAGEIVWRLNASYAEIARSNRVPNLYPVSFSIIVDNYLGEFTDGHILIDGSNTLTMRLINKGWGIDNFIVSLTDTLSQNYFSTSITIPSQTFEIININLSEIGFYEDHINIIVDPENASNQQKIYEYGLVYDYIKLDDDIILDKFILYSNFPNPFNPVTNIRYDLPEYANVNIAIYDMMGRQVKTLVNGSQTAGYRTIQWNATNDEGKPVSAGLYLYTIQAGKFRQTKKMVLLK